jgi:hypothetical protein
VPLLTSACRGIEHLLAEGAYIRRVADTAPLPTPAQLERLAGLLRNAEKSNMDSGDQRCPYHEKDCASAVRVQDSGELIHRLPRAATSVTTSGFYRGCTATG